MYFCQTLSFRKHLRSCVPHDFQSTYYSQSVYAISALAASLNSNNWNVNIKLYHDDTLSKDELDSWEVMLVDQWKQIVGHSEKEQGKSYLPPFSKYPLVLLLFVFLAVLLLSFWCRSVLALWFCSMDSDLTSTLDALSLMIRSGTLIQLSQMLFLYSNIFMSHLLFVISSLYSSYFPSL